MNKIVIIATFFLFGTMFSGCKKDKPEPDNGLPGDGWESFGSSGERSGPGYSWGFSTTDQDKRSEYFETQTSNRQFYLKASNKYARVVTLTVTKRSESLNNPTFRIYGNFQQCLLMSSPTLSSGDYVASGIFQHSDLPGNPKFSGTTWTASLAKSPVNAKATFTFTVYPDSSNTKCTDGFIQADLVFPGQINSSGNYWDGDHIYFVKNSGL